MAYTPNNMGFCVCDCVSHASNVLKLIWHFFDIQIHPHIFGIESQDLTSKDLNHFEIATKCTFTYPYDDNLSIYINFHIVIIKSIRSKRT